MPSNWLPSGRLQSCASSAMSVLVAVSTTPSRSMLARASALRLTQQHVCLAINLWVRHSGRGYGAQTSRATLPNASSGRPFTWADTAVADSSHSFAIGGHYSIRIDVYDVCKQRRILPTAVTSGFEARRIELIGDKRALKILSRRFKPRIGHFVAHRLATCWNAATRRGLCLFREADQRGLLCIELRIR